MSKVASTLEFTTEDFYKCSVLNLRSFIFIVCLFLILSCISAVINSFFIDRDTLDNMLLEEIMKRKRLNRMTMQHVPMRYMESFSNDNFFSDVDALSPNYSNYQFTRLTAPTDMFGNPENTQIGQAYRLLKPASKGFKDTKMELFLDVNCSVFLLNGNPFGQENVTDNKIVEQDYLVYLLNSKTKNKKFISKLVRDGDDIYKFKYQTTDPKEIEELMSFDKIVIVYKINSKEKDVLQGNFLHNI